MKRSLQETESLSIGPFMAALRPAVSHWLSCSQAGRNLFSLLLEQSGSITSCGVGALFPSACSVRCVARAWVLSWSP